MTTMANPFLLAILTLLIGCQEAAILRVSPGENIQDTVDVASPGDTIVVEAGIYRNPDPTSVYGIRIMNNDTRLEGEGLVILEHLEGSVQEIGIHMAPDGCEWNTTAGDGGCIPGKPVRNVHVSGMKVKGFPSNGIQTRCVDDFSIVHSESIDNLNNGLYPTLSTNGRVTDSISHGSRDAGLWPSGCENVTLLNNVLYDNVIGLEVTVSNRIWIGNHTIYNNSVGVGLFHPNESGNPPRPVMADWTLTDSLIYDNNRPNDSSPDTSQSRMPSGFGVFLLGVSDNTVRNNVIRDNGSMGLAVVGYCSALALLEDDPRCETDPPIELKGDRSSNRNQILYNRFRNNGKDMDETIAGLGIPGLDIIHIESPGLGEEGNANCFDNLIPTSAIAVVDGVPSGRFGIGQVFPNGCENQSLLRRWVNRFYSVPAILSQVLFRQS